MNENVIIKNTGSLKSSSLVATKMAYHIKEVSKPKSPSLHLVKGANSTHIFLPDGSRFFPVSSASAGELYESLASGSERTIQKTLKNLGISLPGYINDKPLTDPPIHALSLAIAQKCNMGCMYCYAEQGGFGTREKSMPLETALASIDLLLKNKKKGDRVQLTFLGGEPLMNRKSIQEATRYAYQKAQKKGVIIGFSITTNGTLLREEDASFFEEFGFAVTLSIDGIGKTHDQLRPMKNGTGSYNHILKKIKPLLAIQRNMQVSARVTVTPKNLNLAETLDELIALGFHSVGFSPLLNSSNGKGEMSEEDLELLLEQMIACGLQFEKNVLQGKRYPFLNMVNAYKEINKQTHRPYPCGAGAGYMGVSADGDLAACHRFVNDPKGAMGTVDNGINPELQNSWLTKRHVLRQNPCTGCWARFLCGGGCHHEVLEKGRTACDYIRGWLHYTLQSYERINRLSPQWMY